MSLILDALRKMELERKARRQNPQEIRAEVLSYRGTARAAEKPGIFRIAAVLLFASAAAAGILYFTGPEPQKSDPVKIAEPVREEQPPATPAALAPRMQLPPAEPLPENSSRRDDKALKEAQELAAKTLKSVQKSGEEGLIVSGIAWQDERHLRRAVINGALVGEGAEIQGAKVVEIRENRVRFNRGGELFEVVHSSGAGR